VQVAWSGLRPCPAGLAAGSCGERAMRLRLGVRACLLSWPELATIHPQTCDWRWRACRVHGRSAAMATCSTWREHGTAPLAVELDRLGRAKGR
jgi:hypothetical protein